MEICLQCGDKGFTNAFVYCVKCLDVAVHRYCLDVIPETFDEYVRWVCEDCEEEAENRSASKHASIPSETRDRTVPKNIEGSSGVEEKENGTVVVQTDDPVSKQSYGACKKPDLVESNESASEGSLMKLGRANGEHAILSTADERKRCQQSSSPPLEEEKANDNLTKHAKLSEKKIKNKKRKIRESTIKKDEQSCKGCVKVDIIKCVRLASDSTLPTKVNKNKGSKERDRKRKQFDSDNESDMAELPIIVWQESLKRSKKKKKTVTSSKATPQEQVHRIDSAQPFDKTKELNLENQCAITSIEQRNFGSGNDCIGNRESEDRDLMTVFGTTSAEPVATPIWRGSFKICNQKRDILDGLLAHMSSKACQKVYDAACEFQPVLHFEMLPKSNVWPKSFVTSEPRGDNIALYFFPSDISEQVFDHLVEEMMRNDFALKAVVQNAELLIFTSVELPLLYWRFQDKYYLWGVFRGKQNPSSQSPSSTPKPEANRVINTDLPNNGCGANKILVTTKRCCAQSPLSPLSNSASYGSGTF